MTASGRPFYKRVFLFIIMFLVTIPEMIVHFLRCIVSPHKIIEIRTKRIINFMKKNYADELVLYFCSFNDEKNFYNYGIHEFMGGKITLWFMSILVDKDQVRKETYKTTVERFEESVEKWELITYLNTNFSWYE